MIISHSFANLICFKDMKIMRHFTITYLLCMLIVTLSGRLLAQKVNVQSPLDIPLFLSGNFGELRSTHFHAGIDLKTNGKIGQPVRPLSDGYVSRVKVQAGGYGNAIYIRHNNGYTSVYGHLETFYPAISAYVKNEQYRKKAFEVDLYLEKNKFKVTREMEIGKSGNTGRSGGPHVHLEYRDQNQVPENLLLFDFPVKDTIPPQVRKLVLYDNLDPVTFQWQNKVSYPLYFSDGEYKLNKTIRGHSDIAFGIEAYDYLNGSSNRCGVYSINFYLDGELVFSNAIDKISFGESRYIRSYADYEEKIRYRRSVHRLFVEPNNKLSIYRQVKNRGIISIKDTLKHEAQIIAKDVYGNKSSVRFNIMASKMENSFSDTGKIMLRFDEDNVYENEQLRFFVPKGALYANKWFDCTNSTSGKGGFGKIFSLGDENIPVHKYPELSVKYNGELKGVMPDKLLIVKLGYNGKKTSEGGRLKNGWVTAKVSGFGKYTIRADTVPPVIAPISFREGWYSVGDELVFKITDNLSGIKTYNGYVNDKWVLFEYDAKSNKLSFRIDKEVLKPSKKPHVLKLYVMDERNNLQSFTGTFFY